MRDRDMGDVSSDWADSCVITIRGSVNGEGAADEFFDLTPSAFPELIIHALARRQGPRPRRAANSFGPRRRGDRMMTLFAATRALSTPVRCSARSDSVDASARPFESQPMHRRK